MEKIICLTPNVALDRTLVVPDFAIGHISRIKEGIAVPGGKGLNVMRAMGILKGQPIAMGLLGGHTGQMIADMVKKDDYLAEWTWFEGETRTCTIIAPPDGNSTVINESGQISPSDWSALVDDVCRMAEDITTICLCGSLPLGAPKTAPYDLVKRLMEMGKQVWVDSSKQALIQAIQAKPYAIKVNSDEIGEVLKIKVDTLDSARDAAQQLINDGIQIVVVTLGAEGAMLVSNNLATKATPPKITPVDPIASGDCLHAGLVTSLAKGNNLTEAIRAGVAAGTVNALYAGGAQFTFEHYQQILEQTTVEVI